MKTKNRKRIGPVPIALVAALALAAFLSVGLLLAPNGVQPAAAQDADCTVDAVIPGNSPVERSGATVELLNPTVMARRYQSSSLAMNLPTDRLSL